MKTGSKINTFLKIFDKYKDLDKLITIAMSKSNGNRPKAAEKPGTYKGYGLARRA